VQLGRFFVLDVANEKRVGDKSCEVIHFRLASNHVAGGHCVDLFQSFIENRSRCDVEHLMFLGDVEETANFVL